MGTKKVPRNAITRMDTERNLERGHRKTSRRFIVVSCASLMRKSKLDEAALVKGLHETAPAGRGEISIRFPFSSSPILRLYRKSLFR